MLEWNVITCSLMILFLSLFQSYRSIFESVFHLRPLLLRD